MIKDIKAVETAVETVAEIEKIEKEIRQCWESEKVEAVFSVHKIMDIQIKMQLLQKAMGITGVDFFNPNVDNEIKYEALLVSFESQEWRFYR